jgi:hypothetical protein
MACPVVISTILFALLYCTEQLRTLMHGITFRSYQLIHHAQTTLNVVLVSHSLSSSPVNHAAAMSRTCFFTSLLQKIHQNVCEKYWRGMMSCLLGKARFRAAKRAYLRMGCAHRAHKSYTTVCALWLRCGGGPQVITGWGGYQTFIWAYRGDNIVKRSMFLCCRLQPEKKYIHRTLGR